MNKYFRDRCSDGPKSGKEFWRTVKPFLSNKGHTAGQEIILQENEKLVTDQTEVANILNDFYLNVASDLGPSDNLPTEVDSHEYTRISITNNKDHPSVEKIKERMTHQPSFGFAEVSSDQVQDIIQLLNKNKATGCDAIQPKIIKIANAAISRPIANLFNTSIKTSRFPTRCKEAEVSPVYKKGDALLEI